VIGSGRKTVAAPVTNPYRWYAPRCWHGMRTRCWLRMLRRNRFAISPTRVGLACTVSMGTVVNSILHRVQRVLLGRRIEATALVGDPIFVIGHWRSGTTLLHELLVQDERFAFPDTYSCFAPNHFLVSRSLIAPWLRFLLPSLRPMDNMRISWDRPQEDEFALLAMGLPSPYESLAFPNRIRPGLEHFDDGRWPAGTRQRWKDEFLWFLKCVTYADPRRIVLKSPPHTRRIATLLELFPRARFVHIVRDPCALFASTARLWKSLSTIQGLQVPRNDDLEESVFRGLEEMYATLHKQKERIDPSHLVEIRYEDLVADPRPVMQRIYDHLSLGEFESYFPRLQAYWEAAAGYTASRYDLQPDVRRRIAQRWDGFLSEYGYTI